MSRVGSTTLFFLCSLVAGNAQAGGASCQVHSGAQTGALLELYTSEGCSSCPPADRWLAGMSGKADPARLSLLAFHVDYWDDIGWPDRFASHAYTQRQSERVRTGGSTPIYTPQVMLGSRLDQRWYKPDDVAAAISDAQSHPSAVALALSARADTQRDPQTLIADIKATPAATLPDSAQLYLAIYQNGLSTAVKAGENNGATLHHEHVVRGLWGPWPLPQNGAIRSLRITPPKAAALDRLGLTAFVQDSRTGATLQAVSLPLTGCAAP